MSEKQTTSEISEIVERIKGLNLGQVSELIEQIKGEFNIQETAVVQPVDNGQTSEKSEEKTSNASLKLVDIGSQKVQVYNIIKSNVKRLSGDDISIIKAKELTEKEGGVIWENIARKEADSIKKELEEKGAKVEIK